MRTLALLAGLTVSLGAEAGAFQYDCEVTGAHVVSKGKLEATKPYVGQRFSISRETGEIVGSTAYAMNRGQGWRRLEVLDRGSKDQHFKLIAISGGPYMNVTYITVAEFDNEDVKSLVHYDGVVLSLGLCR